MKIALSTESSSDLPRDLAEKHSIHVIAFTVVKGEETVKDGEETLESLYSFVQEKKTLPRTTAINVEEFKEHFSNLLKECVRSIGIKNLVAVHHRNKVFGI